MSNGPIGRTPAVGQAWHGDWEARVRERIRSRGFRSIADFADANPTASLIALAQELSTDPVAALDRADVAGDQLAQLWRDEAAHAGPDAVEHMARRVLVGELHRACPEGWLQNWTENVNARAAASRLAGAASSWVTCIPDEQREAAHRVFTAMLDHGRAGRIPTSWLPANADDPLLLEVFARCWKDPL